MLMLIAVQPFLPGRIFTIFDNIKNTKKARRRMQKNSWVSRTFRRKTQEIIVEHLRNS